MHAPGDDQLVVEGIVTSENDDGSPHLAPMGPIVDRNLSRFVLRPFATSQTYQNLRRARRGVFHIVDDSLLLAQAAVGQLAELPPMRPAPNNAGWILADACRWFVLSVDDIDDSNERITMHCTVSAAGTLRDHFGWNRAKHAVLEAAILATRLHLLDAEFIAAELARLKVAVDKTAGAQELAAWQFLQSHIQQRLRAQPASR